MVQATRFGGIEEGLTTMCSLFLGVKCLRVEYFMRTPSVQLPHQLCHLSMFPPGAPLPTSVRVGQYIIDGDNKLHMCQ